MRASAKIGMLQHAIMLAAGMNLTAGMTPSQAMHLSDAIKFNIRNHYRVAASGKPSKAAHFKRLAKKRRNMRARSAK